MSVHAGLQFSIGHVHSLSGNYNECVGAGILIYLATVLEYLSNKKL